ncbi:hypothetical protein [Candidatus Clavichlamydia salmonicola]|uniref:hypothetical protein n=1 Tax=Candidatus Clavichlamydia salmonicola TaxID=469812 RepID=UPI0018913954|nr:hypothetical protein [Candidatus Clavichlamydia salmonicola]
MGDNSINPFRSSPEFNDKSNKAESVGVVISAVISMIAMPIFALGASLWYLGKTCVKGFHHLKMASHRPSKKAISQSSPEEIYALRNNYNISKEHSLDELNVAAKNLGKWAASIIPGYAAVVILKKHFKK